MACHWACYSVIAFKHHSLESMWITEWVGNIGDDRSLTLVLTTNLQSEKLYKKDKKIPADKQTGFSEKYKTQK